MTIAIREVPRGNPTFPGVCTSRYAEGMAVEPEAAAHQFGPGSGKAARFAEFLHAEMEARKLSVAKLSHRTGLRYTVIQRWLESPERRVVPSPANCHLVADALGIDEVVVLEAAGHLRGRKVSATPLPPFWEELQALHRREERFMRTLAPEVWDFAKAILEMRIDSTRLLVERHIEAIERAIEERMPGADGSS